MRRFRVIAVVVLAAASAMAENPVLSSVSLSSPSVVGGNVLQGAVTLNIAAPFDIEVSLAADPAKAAKLPASVTVPAGSKSANFTVTTTMSKTAVTGSDIVVTVYGNYVVTKSGSFTVLAPVSFDKMIDRVVERERTFVTDMKKLHPLAETYIQNVQQDTSHNVTPVSDQYFLGRLDFSDGPENTLFQKQQPGLTHYFRNPFSAAFTQKFLPAGFAQMVMLDSDFQKKNYYFNYVRQEFLGEARCIVVDVQPKENAPKGLFTGRIWVEDRDFNIVRFNGTYSARSHFTYYLHFDSWRLNMQPGIWLPAYVYIEESNTKRMTPPFHTLSFKAQTRLWAYDPEQLKHDDEFTNIQVDATVDDHAAARDKSPVEAERMWERMAEDNALDHLQKVGLLAPAGDVDKVLQTVINNLIITNKLVIEPEVRCRVLLTMPLESFTIGHTIVVSRGLLDVLPDEASLAMILSHELGHIVLGHRMDTKFAFTDRFFFPDTDTFQRLDFARNNADEQAADAKATQLLANSPYSDKLGSAALFLKALQDRAPVLTNLIRPHLGSRMGDRKITRMASLMTSGPQLEKQRLDQIAALPIGSRLKLDPWNDHLAMMNLAPVALASTQEKMPFEVTPFFPYLSYVDHGSVAQLVSPSKP